MKLEINLNEKIKVKLNDRGYDYLAKQHNELVGHTPSMELHTADYYKDEADKDGYTEMQFWNFISHFGPVTHIGFQIYYDPNIVIETNF